MSWEIRQGDCLGLLREMPAGSVRCCVTSPPYWGLRDYGTGTWRGGDLGCAHTGRPKPRQDTNGATGAEHGRFKATRGTQPAKAVSSIPVRDVCRCGAVRVDAQLGLEKTPEKYVARLVEVFREARRVLADDGTLWLNLGDSYANDGKWGGYSGGKHAAGLHGATGIGRERRATNLKPKDLVGIPWRVAFALQQSWERHVITAPEWRGWMAGLVDGEGCYSIQAIPAHSENGNESHSVRLQIRMADTEAVDRVVAITGMNSVTYDQLAPSMVRDGQRPAQQWKVSGDKMADLTADIFPFLTVKRRQAVVAWNLQRLRDGVVTKRGVPVPAENMEKRRFLADLGRRLNQREAGVDLPSWLREPAVESESGWYLRSDVIWAKPNPMPESVTDRPTKAHEYVFLLSKNQRYYYDATAIAWASCNRVPGNAKPDKHTAAALAGDPKARTKAGMFKLQQKWQKNGPPETVNTRTVWTVPTQPFPGAHFAVMPEALVEPCVLAGSSAGDLVLDPFAGSGTAGVVALRHGRRFVGLELNAEYVAMARRRIAGPLFAEQETPA